MFTDSNGQKLYTDDDVNNLVNEHQAQLGNITNLERANTTHDLRDKAITWFKSEVQGGSMTKDDALSIFNGLADSLGWDTVANLATLFTVRVSFKGDEVGVFEDIEADDEDSAIEEVRYNVDISDIEVSFSINYDGQSHDVNSSISNYDYEVTEDLEYEAYEQE